MKTHAAFARSPRKIMVNTKAFKMLNTAIIHLQRNINNKAAFRAFNISIHWSYPFKY